MTIEAEISSWMRLNYSSSSNSVVENAAAEVLETTITSPTTDEVNWIIIWRDWACVSKTRESYLVCQN